MKTYKIDYGELVSNIYTVNVFLPIIGKKQGMRIALNMN